MLQRRKKVTVVAVRVMLRYYGGYTLAGGYGRIIPLAMATSIYATSFGVLYTSGDSGYTRTFDTMQADSAVRQLCACAMIGKKYLSIGVLLWVVIASVRVGSIIQGV